MTSKKYIICMGTGTQSLIQLLVEDRHPLSDQSKVPLRMFALEKRGLFSLLELLQGLGY